MGIETERFAFVTAKDKTGVEDLAGALSRHFSIVSLGRTASVIEEAGIEVIQTVDFIDDPFIAAVAARLTNEREIRELYGGRVAQCMCLSPDSLRQTGRRAIDLAYINPMPPELVNGGIKPDKGALDMLWGAVEGNHTTVLTQPNQIPYTIGWLDVEQIDPEIEILERLIAKKETLEAIQKYDATVSALGTGALVSMIRERKATADE